jgi:hypothetical protein
MSREAIERHKATLADSERRAGKVPESRKIEQMARADFASATRGVKPGRDHPLTRSRGGERK